MKEYLTQEVNTGDPKLVSVIDDLPLWSAPFGMKLLEIVELKKNITALDVGCGLGFPTIELAERLGSTCSVYGIDPWEEALERVRLKLKVYNIKNVFIINGYAENMPFDDGFIDLIVSNNGMNNVKDMNKSLTECYRVCKPGAQMVMTFNSDGTMIEFYSVFRDVLEQNNLFDEVSKMKIQIYLKRKPLSEIEMLLEKSGFSIESINHDSFKLRFVDGTTMLNHYLIRYWFLDGWKTVLAPEDMEKVFDEVELRLNKIAENEKELVLSVPFVIINSKKK
ncbi:class I SAM-dependent methyltransferase [Bacteroidota bacterium]